VTLEAELESGARVLGESRIGRVKERISRIRLTPRRVKPLPAALEAIAAADVITLGPGSLYTSVIPNLLVSGIPKALRQARAAKVYFANLMWQPWETMHYSAADHLDAIERHAGAGLVDYVVVNTRHIGGERRRRYAAEKVYPVKVDLPRLEAMGVEVIGRNLLARNEKVRHDPAAVARVAVELIERARAKNIGT